LVTFLLQLLPYYIVLLLLIQLVPVRINLFFIREAKNDFLTIRVNTFFSLLRFSVEVPIIEQKTPLDVTVEAELEAGNHMHMMDEKMGLSVFDINWDKVQKVLNYVKKNRPLLTFISRFYIRAMTVEKLVLKVRAGVDDAALTGLLSGLYWTLTGTFTALARRWLQIKEEPVFAISSDYSPDPVFAVKLDAVVGLRIGHFTVGSFLFLITIIRGGRM
jgi:hypothetical protein